MKAVNLVDLCNIKALMKNLIFNIVLMFMYPLIKAFRGDFDNFAFIVTVVIINYLGTIISSNSYYIDGSNKYLQYMKALPLEVKDYVGSKFKIIGIFSLIDIVILSLIAFISYGNLKIMPFVLALSCFLNILGLFNFTMMLKYNENKLAIAPISIDFLIVAAIIKLQNNIGPAEFFEILKNFGILMPIAMIILNIFAYLFLRRCSVKILEERSYD
ncbi:ABC-2 transporter permease [Peptoniphilus catoniae]|uniref:ABC-2 transporter permease n=1 Tax=Peptoniphilus catoniae TaxID=1660341 RepID=UPI0010FEA712|nr:ABC-2 transporter permease [Peptoniphilus catoniae]